jgi:hypothetical protein
MKKTLEDLWYSYLMDQSWEKCDEKKAILSALAEKEDALRSVLTAEQKNQYEDCEKLLLELYSLSERDAFVKGACFATKFLLEALSS